MVLLCFPLWVTKAERRYIDIKRKDKCDTNIICSETLYWDCARGWVVIIKISIARLKSFLMSPGTEIRVTALFRGFRCSFLLLWKMNSGANLHLLLLYFRAGLFISLQFCSSFHFSISWFVSQIPLFLAFVSWTSWRVTWNFMQELQHTFCKAGGCCMSSSKHK